MDDLGLFYGKVNLEVAHAFEWGKMLKCHLKGKTCSKLANGLRFYDLKKKLTPGVALTRCPRFIYIYITIIVKKFIGIYLRFQVSVYRTIGPLVYLFIYFAGPISKTNLEEKTCRQKLFAKIHKDLVKRKKAKT